MAFQVPGFAVPNCQAASTALSTRQFHFVRVLSAGTVGVISALGQAPIGILQENPKQANQAVNVMGFGVSRVVAGGALVPGNRIRVNATGRAVAHTGGSHFIVGQVLPGGGAAASALATVFINCANLAQS